jgi:hypothetical protein
LATRVVHCQRERYDIYIGRAMPRHGLKASKWGNPFPLPRTHTPQQRAEVVAKYERWLLSQPELVAALPELRGKVLGCWCSPNPCHGDVLARLANGAELG